MKYLYILFLCVGFSTIQAQDSKRRTTASTSEAKKEGYSLILKSTKVQTFITEENLKEIEKLRAENDYVMYDLNDYVTVKIYPKSMLRKED